MNVLGIFTLDILTTPDAGRQGKAMTRLTVKTQGPSVTGATGATTGSLPQNYIETLNLPAIKMQQWTMVTITHQARRIDVYYDDTIVLSKIVNYMPISSSLTDFNGRGITVGSPGLNGQVALVSVFPTRYTTQQVGGLYKAQADTRGAPYGAYTASSMTISDPSGMQPTYAFSLDSLQRMLPLPSLCPPEGCFNPPVIRPASPVYGWSISYA
jgi:hypothetical protein